MLHFTDEEIVQDAQSYPTRTAWKAGSPQKYSLVHRRLKHLRARCTELMGPKQGPFFAGYEVYIYRFSDGSLYIGITSNPSRRHCYHRTVGLVRKKGLSWKLRTVGRGLRMGEAAETEKRWIALAKAKGRVLLNKSEGGEIGGISQQYKYTYEEVLKIAASCCSLADLNRRRPEIYNFMYVRGMAARIRTACGWLISRPVKKWTFERCREEALKYQYSIDWKTASRVSYQASHERGWLSAISKEAFPRKKGQRVPGEIREFRVCYAGQAYRVTALTASKAKAVVVQKLKRKNQKVVFLQMTATLIKNVRT